MVKASTTKDQAKFAKERGEALFCYSCKTSGTVSMDGAISHAIANPLNALIGMILLDRVPAERLQEFVDSL